MWCRVATKLMHCLTEGKASGSGSRLRVTRPINASPAIPLARAVRNNCVHGPVSPREFSAKVGASVAAVEARVAGWLDEGDGIDRTLRVRPRARSVTRGLSGIVALAALAAVLASGCASRVDEAGRGGARAGDHAGGAVRAEKQRVDARGAGRRHKARAAGNGTIPRGARTDVVAYVVDGDTVALARLGRARLIGIDTPEVYGQVECYGRQASAFTKRLLAPGTRVYVRLGTEPRDRYGRALVYLWRRDGLFVNRELALRGYAQQLTIPPNVEYADVFRRAVAAARAGRRGLWGRACAGGSAAPSVRRPSFARRSRAYRDGGGGSFSAVGSAGDKDCSDFRTQAAAQAYFDARGGSPTNNVDRLDGADHDGRVCETLP